MKNTTENNELLTSIREKKIMINCVNAIGARIDGEWDNDHLKCVGYLHSSLMEDIRKIIKFYTNQL